MFILQIKMKYKSNKKRLDDTVGRTSWKRELKNASQSTRKLIKANTKTTSTHMGSWLLGTWYVYWQYLSLSTAEKTYFSNECNYLHTK